MPRVLPQWFLCPRRPRLSPAACALLTCTLFLACSEPVTAPDRNWGHGLAASKVEAKAQEPIDLEVLATDLEVRQRVFTMSLREAHARAGRLGFSGRFQMSVTRNRHDLDLDERVEIIPGVDGGVRVVHRNADDSLAREGIRVGPNWYVRNGQGALRKADFVQSKRLSMDEEAFSGLRSLWDLVGPRLQLERKGAASVAGRASVCFRVTGVDAAPVEFGAHSVQPKGASGTLCLDEASGAPLRYELRSSLSAPDASGMGMIRIAVSGKFEPSELQVLDIDDAVPPLMNPKVDLDPLAFLRGSTRTSTVIGGDD